MSVPPQIGLGSGTVLHTVCLASMIPIRCLFISFPRARTIRTSAKTIRVPTDTSEKCDVTYASKGRKHSQPVWNTSSHSPFFTPPHVVPEILPEAAQSVLHELSYMSTGGLCEAIQYLLLERNCPTERLDPSIFGQSQSDSCHSNDRLRNSSVGSFPFSNYKDLSPSSLVSNCMSTINPSYSIQHPGELHRRLTKLQWIGFLQQQVKRTGPTGRFVVNQLCAKMPYWDTVPLALGGDDESSEHALHLDRETFMDRISESLSFASGVNGGRDWAEDLLLLARSLYPS